MKFRADRMLADGAWAYCTEQEAAFAIAMLLHGLNLAAFDNWLEVARLRGDVVKRLAEQRRLAIECFSRNDHANAIAVFARLVDRMHRVQLLEVIRKQQLKIQRKDGRRKLPADDDVLLGELARLTKSKGTLKEAKSALRANSDGTTSQALNKRLRKIEETKSETIAELVSKLNR